MFSNQKTKGILLIICSAFCFACMNLFVRMSGDIPSFQKSFFRNLVAFAFAIGLILKNRTAVKIEKNAVFPLIFRSCAGTIGILCNFYAVDHLKIADASLLNKLSPFFVVIFSFLFLNEKIKGYQFLCILTAFAGSLFVIKPTPEIFENPAALIGALGGMSAGAAYAFVRLCSKKGVKGPVIVAFFSGFSCLTVLPMVILQYEPMSGKQIMYLLLSGLAAAGGQFTITSAYTHAPAREISIYDYTQILFSTCLGFVFLSELPDLYSIIGYVIIIGASVAMFKMNMKRSNERG